MEEVSMYTLRMRFPSCKALLICALALLSAVMVPGAVALAAQPEQKTFESPEGAAQALFKSLGSNSEKDLLAIFGPGGGALISSGDAVEDRKDRKKFILRYNEKSRMETVGDGKVVLHVGSNDWPFPIPIVRSGERWRFDTKQGRDELLSRRIGKNELRAIKTCQAIVYAQREYAAMDIDRDGLLEYARKFVSTEAKKDGLYWKQGPGEGPSPLGPLAAQARREGYGKGAEPAPYNGYFYRMLEAQGRSAHGGAYSYLVKGKMVGGFAVVAYPARRWVSGIKTFIVNHDGIVYQKDLGPKTDQLAKAMKEFNPDKAWEKVE
jgi:hypothetical protein